MEEVWKHIANADNGYEVSSLGNIRSLDKMVLYKNLNIGITKGKPSKLTLNNYGYYIKGIYINGKATTMTVHRMVALTFIPNSENKPCINHKNGIKTDNRVENLEWCTYSENIIHAYKTGLIFQPTRDELTNANNKSCVQLDKNGNIVATYHSRLDAEAKTGIHHQNISHVINGDRAKAGGFFWEDA